jgi:Na+-translocating ferredoxin:NAD+ oxidoreductase RnfG subunit
MAVMPESRGSSWRAIAAFLTLVVGCAALIAGTAAITGERIDENRTRHFQRTLTELTGSPASAASLTWRNDIAMLTSDATEQGETRALLRGATGGYGGDIRWLAAVRLGCPAVLDNLRITAHQETPGIADFLNAPEQGWLASLHGRSSQSLAEVQAVSGATITSRALRGALRSALNRSPPTGSTCPR